MNMNKDEMYDKFITGNRINDEYEILTPNGWINIEGVGKTKEFIEWELVTESGKEIICADTHILGKCDNINIDKKTYDLTEIYVKDININDYIMTKTGPEKVLYLYETSRSSNMYDLQLSEGSNKHYYTNDILTHNSLFLQNLAVNSVNAGYNVAYITLELSDKKCLKRIGSMRLNIPISEYTSLSRDAEFMKERINDINKGNGMFGNKPGKLLVQEYPSGSCTLSDIERYLKLVKEQLDLDIDMLVVDYIQIMGTEKNVDRNMLYLKGEHLAVGLRAIAQRHNLVCLTATQTSKEKYGANDAALNDIPESKAIADTVDTAWAIIMTPIMKVEGTYHLKPVKLRDSGTDYERIGFKLNKKTLRIYDDTYIASTL